MHTGQHHDDELSSVFVRELGIPPPDRELGIAGGSNTSQTSRMMDALEPAIEDVAPDLVLVYGDTNSTLAGALAAAQHGSAGGARGGGNALVRPFDARGGQPGADRSPERVAALPVADGRGQPRPRARRGPGRVGRRRHGRRGAAVRPARPRTPRRARGPRRRGGRLPPGHRAPGRHGRRPDTPAGAGRAPDHPAAPGGAAPAPAHARTPGGRGSAGRAAGARVTGAPDPAARLPRVHRAASPRSRGAHRLGRGAEGGLPGRGSLRDAARYHRVGGDRAGGLERARRSRRRGGARGARSHRVRASTRRCTATATPASASRTPSRGVTRKQPPRLPAS